MGKSWSDKRRCSQVLRFCWQWAIQGCWAKQSGCLDSTKLNGVIPVARLTWVSYEYVSSGTKISKSHWCSAMFWKTSQLASYNSIQPVPLSGVWKGDVQWLRSSWNQIRYKGVWTICSQIVCHCLLASRRVSRMVQSSYRRRWKWYASCSVLRWVLLMLACSNNLSVTPRFACL